MEKLKQYGEEPTVWYGLLKPVMTRFVRTFEVLDSEEVLNFWQRIVHYKRGRPGPSYLSGWITAFYFWTENGRCIYKDPGPETERNHRSVCAPKVPWTERQKGWNDLSYPYLVLDGVAFNRVYMESIPQGYGSMSVKVDDHGEEIETVMVAGSVGIECLSSGKEIEGGGVGSDTVQPVSGWWMFEKNEKNTKE